MTSMVQNLIRHKTRIARVLLVLFVMAWVNLVLQAPAHAAMKMNHDMPCHCTHDLCDTVLGMQDQADDALAAAIPAMADIPMLFVLIPVTVQSNNLERQYQHAHLVFLQTNPPPITRTGVLRI